MKVFVTVGTTRFDDLIYHALQAETLECLRKIGVTLLRLQIGASNMDLVDNDDFKKSQDQGVLSSHGITIEYYKYKPSIHEDLLEADFIIGHAGAGTVLECLRLQKPLVVVINEKLMNNHQSELAIALADRKHVLYCVPQALKECVQDSTLFHLTPYYPPDQKKVANFISRRLGVINK